MKLINVLQTNDIIELKRMCKKSNFKDLVNELSSTYLTPIWYMKKDNLSFSKEIFDILVENGVYLEHSNDYGQTILMYCIERGYTIMSEELLKADCDIDTRDRAGMTALHYAVYNLDVEVVKNLIECDINIYIEDNEGYTALDYLLIKLNHQFVENAKKKREEIIKILESVESD